MCKVLLAHIKASSRAKECSIAGMPKQIQTLLRSFISIVGAVFLS